MGIPCRTNKHKKTRTRVCVRACVCCYFCTAFRQHIGVFVTDSSQQSCTLSQLREYLRNCLWQKRELHSKSLCAGALNQREGGRVVDRGRGVLLRSTGCRERNTNTKKKEKKSFKNWHKLHFLFIAFNRSYFPCIFHRFSFIFMYSCIFLYFVLDSSWVLSSAIQCSTRLVPRYNGNKRFFHSTIK